MKTDRLQIKKYRLYTELWHASETDLRGYGGLSSKLRYNIENYDTHIILYKERREFQLVGVF